MKSRESLVMDEADPFGAAPFRIQSDLTQSLI